MPAIASLGDEILALVATAGTAVAVPWQSAAQLANGSGHHTAPQALISNRTGNWARVDFSADPTGASAANLAAFIEPTALGGYGRGFSVGPGAQIVVSIKPGMQWVLATSLAAGDICIKPVSGD